MDNDLRIVDTSIIQSLVIAGFLVGLLIGLLIGSMITFFLFKQKHKKQNSHSKKD